METSCIILTPARSQQQGGREDERKSGVEGKERSAADRFCFSLRVEKASGCFQESLKSKAPPTKRRRDGWSERAVQHTCLSFSLPLCNVRSVQLRRMSLLFLPFQWVTTSSLSYCVSFVLLTHPHPLLDSCLRLQFGGFVFSVFCCW